MGFINILRASKKTRYSRITESKYAVMDSIAETSGEERNAKSESRKKTNDGETKRMATRRNAALDHELQEDKKKLDYLILIQNLKMCGLSY